MDVQFSTRSRARVGFALMALGAIVFVAAATASAGPRAQAQTPGPVTITGNPTCGDLEPSGADWTELKVEPVVGGVYTDGTLSVTLTVVNTANGPTINWTSNIGVDSVVVKGGPNASFYLYPAESTADSGLHAPVNPTNGTYFGLSHVSFCYDTGGTPLNTTTTSSTTAPTTTTSTTSSTTTTTAPTTTTSATSTTTAPSTTTSTTAPSTTTSTTVPSTTTSTQPGRTTVPSTTTTLPVAGARAVPPSPPRTLPATGSDTTPWLLTGMALLIAGGGLVASARRMRRS